MAQFDESKHPRDKDGKFTNGNGINKSETEKRAELVKKYSSEPERDLREVERNTKKYNPRLDSAVMKKYSTVIKKVEKFGYAITYVNDGNKGYLVRINKSDSDFNYDVINEGNKNE
jgi:hypothetical protein